MYGLPSFSSLVSRLSVGYLYRVNGSSGLIGVLIASSVSCSPFAFSSLPTSTVSFSPSVLIGVGVGVAVIIGSTVALFGFFADFLAEEVGVEFLQAFILDTDIADDVLDVDEPTWFELATAMEREQVVVPRKTNHWHEFVAEQAHERIGQTDVVETEQKALVVGSYLEQRNLMVLSTAECRARLGVDPQHVAREKIVDSAVGF
jgi:hypothetical protein